jgi:ribosomal-protein-alanine N-acetyltransferase
VTIGEVHFTCNWRETHEWEIGYKFLKEYWGAGFASEAVSAVINHAFKNFNVNRIVAFLNSKNKRSAALCERIGMLKECCLREAKLVKGIYYDEYIFSALKREFEHSL